MKKNTHYFSISQAAKELNVSQETLRRWERAGKITTTRLDGKNRSFAKKEIEKIKATMPLSISQASTLLGISINVLRRLVDNGTLKSHRNERHERVFYLKELESFKSSQKEKKGAYIIFQSTKKETNKYDELQESVITPIYSPLDMAHVIVRDTKTLAPQCPDTVVSEPIPAEPTSAEIITTTEEEKTTSPDSFAGDRLSHYFPVNKIRIIATISAAVFLLTFLPLVTIVRLKHPTLPPQTLHGQVLAASTQRLLGTLAINLPVEFTNDVNLQGKLTAESLSLFKKGLIVQQGDIEVQNGTVTAPNLIYSVTGGDGVTVTGGQNPVVSFSGVTSLGGQTGDLSLTAGDGISIDGLKISSTDQTSGLKIFKTIKIGSNTLDASSNADTLTFVAGNNVSLNPNLTDNTITISGTATDNSGWINDGSFVTLKDSTENVGIGTSAPSHTLDISGTLNATGDTTLSSNLTVGGSTTLAPTQSGATTLTLRASTTTPGDIFNVTNSSGSNSYLSIDSTGALTVGGSTLTNAGILEAGNAIHLTDSSNAIIGTAVAGGWTFNSNTFTYRRTITVTNTSSTQTLPVNQQITASLTGSTASDVCSNTRSDSNDIRIGYSNSEIARNITRNCNTELNISFQLQAAIAPNGSDTYYVYYGNSSLTQSGQTYTYSSVQLDNADDASQWISSDNTNLAISQETTIKQEGTGSVKMDQTAQPISLGTLSTTGQTQLPVAKFRQGLVTASVNGTTYVYMVGGAASGSFATNDVYRATVDANGNIGAWSKTNQSQFPVTIYQESMFAATTGGTTYIYVLAGNGSANYTTVYRATIDASGNVGTWSTSGQGQLPAGIGSQNMNGVATVTVGATTYVYFGGGFGPSSALYRATVDANGNIGAWSNSGQTQLPFSMYAQALRSISINGSNYLYTIGGNVNGSYSTAVYKASVDASGNVGAWSTSGQGQLPQSTAFHDAVIFTSNNVNSLYVLGGYNGSNLDTVYKASIDSSGNIGSFSTANQGQLPVAIRDFRSFSLSVGTTNYLYVIGGNSTTGQKTVYRGEISAPSYTATKTISSADLSNKGGIQFKFLSSRTGSYLNFEFSNDNGATWTSKSFSISSANTWETKTLDITGIANNNKNTVTKLRFQVTDSSQAFTAYFDDIQAIPSPYTDTDPSTSAASAVLGSSDLTLNAQGAGQIKLNYDPTNLAAGTGGFSLYNGGSNALFSINSSGNITAAGLSTGILHSDSSGLLSSSALNLAGSSAEITGTLATSHGGTGLTSYVKGSMLYASATDVLSSLAIGSTGQILQVVGGIPQWVSASNAGITFLQENNGALAPNHITDDLLIGGTSTASALIKFSGTTGGNSWINTGGNFGIGTTNPTSKLYVNGDFTATGAVSIGNFNMDATPTCGNTYHTFVGSIGTVGGDECAALNVTQADSGGNIIYRFGAANAAWAGEFYVNSSLVGMNTKNSLPLSFQVNTNEKMRIDANGNVGIGTSNPQFPLDVGTTVSSTQTYGFLNASGGTGTATGTNQYSIRATGRVLASEFNAVSDERLKNVQFDMDPDIALDAITKLQPVSFTWKSNPDGQPILGFLAQDVEKVIPNAVSQMATANFPDQRELDYNQLIAVSIGAVKQLNANQIAIQNQVNSLSSPESQSQTISSLTDKINNTNASVASLSASLDSVKDQLETLQDLNLTPFITSNSADASITTIDNSLLVMGTTSLNDVAATTLSIGTTMKIDGSSINSLGEPLAIEPLKQANIDFMGGEVSIKTDGTLSVNQNASFAKDVEVKGAATVGSLNIIKAASVDLSPTETQASASAGTTSITAGYKYRMIDSELVQSDSLIYVTPLTDTDNQVLFVTDQNPGKSFTVKVHATASADIKFNYLIVNQK